ncbi:MAG: hypothetical protein KAS38_12750 [Anaerolineales bacterium]|nr:hypothetical protein [Anaerolineales bacterium]
MRWSPTSATTHRSRQVLRTASHDSTRQRPLDPAPPEFPGVQLLTRAYHHILILARTIAKLTPFESIIPIHLAAAIQYHRNKFIECFAQYLSGPLTI